MTERGYGRYLLVLLVVVAAFNGVERLALGLVLQDIKWDLGLSDTQLGFLTGLSFAFFYAVMGIPIARWADRGNRVAIISVGTIIWGAAVALCGVASSFFQLLGIRIAVAVGEASCNPAAYSLVTDHFSRAERPRAVAIYMLHFPVAVLLGFFVAGWLNQLYGWRATFVILGLSGVLPAALAWLTLREPRQAAEEIDGSDRQEPHRPSLHGQSVWAVFLTLWHNKTFRHLLIALSIGYFFAQGITTWMSAFFIRSHGLKTGELGVWLGLIFGLGGLLGTTVGGELASRYAANNESLQLKAIGTIYAAFALISMFIFLSPNRYEAFAAMAVLAIVNTMTYGPLFATIQTLVPESMRATAIAVLYLFHNLIGMGLGPLAAGVMSDLFRPWAGEESLRYALVALSCGYVWAGWHFWRASRTVATDLQSVVGEMKGSSP